VADGVEVLQRGRDLHARRAWRGAYEALAAADLAAPLGADDLELLARSAYMLGRDGDYVSGLERAHHAHLAGGEGLRAVRCAFWIGHSCMFRGEAAPAAGWFARARRLLEREGRECVERGYLLIPDLLGHSIAGDFAAAHATACAAAAIAERFRDDDLVAIAVMEQGHALVRLGRAEEGLRLVDETMVAVTTGELSPIVAGIVYCNTIAFCRGAHELRRAREWTAALTRWCDQQPDMVAHNGLCLVHRAEIMTFGGAWREALEELRRLGERFTEGVLNQRALGHAAYREGEIHRLRGDFAAAEAAYRTASQRGMEAQPGLALVRLAQGNGEAAAAAIRRAVTETTLPLRRAALLPAYVQIMLAVGDVEIADSACRELEGIARRHGSDLVMATAAHARGAVALAGGDPATALGALRGAAEAWRGLGAPYEEARARMLMGLACRALGDEDTATLELQAARGAFADLGASPDVAGVDTLTGRVASARVGGLTDRELEVLRLVAAGRSNRQIGAALVISEHTVARHVQNIFAKLGVSSRTAASAFAFEHGIV
jgi:DNA-binding CsgD family transcriptional regulator